MAKKVIGIFNDIGTAVSIVLLLIGFLSYNLDFMLFSVIVILLSNIIYGLRELKSRILFLTFNITFFTLLLGERVILYFTGEQWYSANYSQIERNTLLLFYLSLMSIYIGSVIYFYCKKRQFQNNQEEKNEKTTNSQEEKYRRIIRICAYTTLLIALLVVIEKVIFVAKNSYISDEEFTSMFPFIILKLANMQITFAYLYLCIFPKKKETFIFTAFYVIYLIASIFTGVRGEFVVGIITLLIYYIYRQYHLQEKYFTPKSIGILGIIGVLCIVFLSSYNILRNKQTIEDFSVGKEFKQFFIDQSTSSDVLFFSQKYEEVLPKGNWSYTFGILYNKIMNKQYGKIEGALYGNNLGTTISYYAMPERYLEGHGLGTQYIAELYIDFSYLGVIIYNLILGFAMIGIMDIRKEKDILLAIGFGLITCIIYLPRQFSMGWTTYLVSFSFIIPIITAVLLKYLIKYKEKANENTLDC